MKNFTFEHTFQLGKAVSEKKLLNIIIIQKC